MNECDICSNRIKKRNRIKRKQSKKPKYFSNLIMNKYTVINYEIDKYKDILQSHYDKHNRKIDNIIVWGICKLNIEIVRGEKVPSSMIVEKRYITSRDDGRPLILMESCVKYLTSCFYDCGFCDEINIIVISDLKDKAFFIIWNNQDQCL